MIIELLNESWSFTDQSKIRVLLKSFTTILYSNQGKTIKPTDLNYFLQFEEILKKAEGPLQQLEEKHGTHLCKSLQNIDGHKCRFCEDRNLILKNKISKDKMVSAEEDKANTSSLKEMSAEDDKTNSSDDEDFQVIM